MSERMTLDKIGWEDLNDYLSIIGDPSVGEYDKEYPKVGADALKSFNDVLSDGKCTEPKMDCWRVLGIRWEDKSIVGLASYRLSRNHSTVLARLGIHIRSGFRGKGLSSFAVQALTGFLTTSTDASIVQMVVDPNNEPSIWMCERNGFFRAGLSGGDLVFVKELR